MSSNPGTLAAACLESYDRLRSIGHALDPPVPTLKNVKASSLQPLCFVIVRTAVSSCAGRRGCPCAFSTNDGHHDQYR